MTFTSYKLANGTVVKTLGEARDLDMDYEIQFDEQLNCDEIFERELSEADLELRARRMAVFNTRHKNFLRKMAE